MAVKFGRRRRAAAVRVHGLINSVQKFEGQTSPSEAGWLTCVATPNPGASGEVIGSHPRRERAREGDSNGDGDGVKYIQPAPGPLGRSA